MKPIVSIVPCVVLLLSACAVMERPPRPNDDPAQSSRLADLLTERSNDQQAGVYRIGVGDKLQVSVARGDEFSGEYAVPEDGQIVLPLLGAVTAAGKTEEEVSGAIAAALRAEYMQSPEVIVSVTNFRGRRVSVTGAVAKPGFYELRGGRETVLDLLTRAGGISEEASPQVFLSPAADGPDNQKRIAMAGMLGLKPAALITGDEQKPIEIDLTDLYRGWTVPALQLPVRGGDVIFVKDGGQVYVEGWVADPKAYPLKRAMTLTQAVAKAGGLHFAASPGAVVLARTDDQGVVRKYRVNFPALQSGAEKDVYLEAGDRIEVAGQPVKVGAWAIYNTLTTLVKFSIAGGISAF